jgi:hypothetical protein
MSSINTTLQSFGSSSRTSGSSSSKNSTSSTQKSSLFGKELQWLPRSQSSRSSLSTHSSIGRNSDSSDLSAHTIEQVPSGLSKEAITQQGSLFSVRDFETIASKLPLGSFYSGRSALLGQLKTYEKKSAGWSNDEKLTQLAQLKEATQKYHDQKVDLLLQNPKTSKAEKENAKANILAAKHLLSGIELEEQKITASDQFNAQVVLATSSLYRPDNEDKQKGTSTNNSGNMTEVTILSYKIPQGDTTIERVGYFKPIGLEKMDSPVAKDLGIPDNSTLTANLSGRSVATYRMSQLLGFSSPSSETTDLVPETQFAFHAGHYGSCQLKAEGNHLATEERRPLSRTEFEKNISSNTDSILGAIKEDENLGYGEKDLLLHTSITLRHHEIYETGKQVSDQRVTELIDEGKIQLTKKVVTEVSDVNFKDPALQEDLSNAQILDFLTGQLDRHRDNFLYKKEGEKWHARLIDNDLSFPEKFTKIQDRFPYCATDKWFREKFPLVSRSTAEKISNLTEKNITKSLEQTGLTKEEINATVSRFNELKEHIQQLSEDKKVEKFDDSTFEQFQKASKQPDNYVALGETNKLLAQQDLRDRLSMETR